ncbi:c-type cytochrome [Stutzerimonas nitrititolerans]|uniref:c-type cytochrome n=1 Tax=Stutzerimonas nitrititolerans TaxID=2482751 RepID=UPI000F7AF5D2|nr:cytochrome c [Stutzerimonas nitrititolerans]RRV26122.1 cytochrome c [Pseudomonas sp. s199]
MTTYLRPIATALALMAVGLSGPAYAASNDPVDERKQGYKAAKKSVERIAEAIDAGDWVTLASSAQSLATFAERIPELYPAGSTGGFFNRAKGAIWTNFPDFVEKSQAFKQAADNLQQLAALPQSDREQLSQAHRELGDTCVACHRAYRSGPN